MSEKDLLDGLNVTSPCTADWESMVGNDQVRFCKHCNLSVQNLSALTRKHALKLIARSSGRLCVRYVRLPDGAIKTRSGPPSSHRLGRHASRIAAGAFSATLTVSGGAAARVPFDRSLSPSTLVSPSVSVRRSSIFASGGSLRGFIFDPSGAVITGALVILTSAENKGSRMAITNENGEYRFGEFEPGQYVLKVRANGFTSIEVSGIELKSDTESRIDQTLAILTSPAEEDVDRVVEVQGGVALPLPNDPLVRAAQSDDIDEVTRLLVGKPNVNVRDKQTNSTALEHALLNANREMVQLLLQAGADVNAKDRSGRTPLMMLGEETTPEAVWDLIHAGAKVNGRDNEGDTALSEAAVCNNLEVLKALLDAGAKVDAKNNDGQTALMRAADEGLVNNVRMLIRAGANVNARDGAGKTAWNYASDNYHAAVLRLLRSYGADETPEPAKR